MTDENGLRIPPHSLEAEQSVLGALLLDNQAYDRVSFLKVSDFYADSHRRIYGALQQQLDRGHGVDLVLLAEHLEKAGDLDKVGGPAYLGSMAQNTPGSFNIVRYAELVRDKAILRALLTHAYSVAEKALAGTTAPKDLAEEAEQAFLTVLDGGTASEVVHIGQAATEYIEWTDNHPNGIEMGLTDLDAMTGGLLPGNLVVIAGRTHMGKTSCALQMAEHICGKKRPGIMFSLEGARREIAGRMIEWHKHRIGRDAAVDKVFSLPFYIDDTAGISPAMMRSRLRRTKRQHGVSLVVVDYLQLVAGKGENRQEEVSSVSRALKAIAKDFEVPVIALAQLSRKVEERTDKRPHMSDLRESGAIEQDADLIMFLYRPDYYDRDFHGPMAEAEVIVAKNRNNGRSGTVKVMFHREIGRFGDFIPEAYRAGAA